MPAPLETFTAVARAASTLVADGPAALRVLRPYVPFPVVFDIHFRDKAVAAAVDDLDLSREDFQRAIVDLQEVLGSIVADTDIDRTTSEGEPEDEETTQAKITATREYFDVPALQRRWWAKLNAKTDVLVQTGWDVSLKLLDEVKRPPDDNPVPIGILNFKGSRLSTPLALLENENTELLITVDREDVKALTHALRRLDEALADAGAGADSDG